MNMQATRDAGLTGQKEHTVCVSNEVFRASWSRHR